MTDFVDQVVCPLRETGPGNLRNSEGAVIELDDGRLLLAYTHFYRGGEDWAAGDIRGKLSEDDGTTWSEPFVVHPNTARCNSGRLALIRLPEPSSVVPSWPSSLSVLGLIYVDLNLFYDTRLYLTTSADEGQTWSRDLQINQTGTLGHICQRGDTALVLSSGRILVPVYALFGGMCASFMYYSDDAGSSWSRSYGEISVKLVEAGRNYAYADFEEPAVVELRDGRLLCFGRTRLGQLYQSFSEDQGITWSEAEPTGLASSYSPASLKTIPETGDILCVWHQTSGQEIADGLGRMRMSCAISTDDGQSWAHFKNLESLDDRTRIEPEADAHDAVTELHAIRERQALKNTATQAQYPEEVISRYPHWPGYVHVDYPSATFTSTGNVVIIYLVAGGERAGLTSGLKLLVRPIEWLYDD